MFIKHLLRLILVCALMPIGGLANAQATFSIAGPGATEAPPYDIENASPNFDPPWGILQSPAETIYRSLSPSTGTTLFLSAQSNVTFQYIGHGDASFINEFKVFDALGSPLLIWCTQGSNIVGCPEAKINPGYENGPTTPVVSSTTAVLHNLPAGELSFAFIGNISAEGVPGPTSGAVFNTGASNVCGTDAATVGAPPHPGDVCYGIAVPNGAGTSGLRTVKLGFKDGGQSVSYDPDFQDMAIKVTIAPAGATIPTMNVQGLLALTLVLAVAAMWRFPIARR